MSRKKILYILQSLLCVAIVVLLAFSCVEIYQRGIAEKQVNPLAIIYSPEIAWKAITRVLPIFFIALGVHLSCLILGIRDEELCKPVKDVEVNRDLAIRRIAGSSPEMKKERKCQRFLLVVGWLGFLACMVPILLYFLDGSHFPKGGEKLEPMIAATVLHVVPWTILGLGIRMVTTLLEEKSIQREYDLILKRAREEKTEGRKIEEPDFALSREPDEITKSASEPCRQVETGFLEERMDPVKTDLAPLRLFLIGVAVALILLGIRNGSLTSVINKAIMICTECVGLG